MDNQQLNFEEYAQTLARVMAEAVAKAEALQEEAIADREAAHTDDQTKRDLLHDLENKAQRKAEDGTPALSKQLKAEMTAHLIARLKKSGFTESKIELLFGSSRR